MFALNPLMAAEPLDVQEEPFTTPKAESVEVWSVYVFAAGVDASHAMERLVVVAPVLRKFDGAAAVTATVEPRER